MYSSEIFLYTRKRLLHIECDKDNISVHQPLGGRMTAITRRSVVTTLAALAASPLLSLPAWAQTTALTISHQFPGGTINDGDFRDRMTRMFAAEVEKRSKGSLKFAIYPGSSLMKTN